MVRRKRLAAGVLLTSVAIFLSVATAVFAQKQPPAKPIDLNSASVKDLQQLPGVGPVTAQRIVEMRDKSGRFRRVEDLLAIRGISQKKLAALRPYVMVSSATSPAAPPKKH